MLKLTGDLLTLAWQLTKLSIVYDGVTPLPSLSLSFFNWAHWRMFVYQYKQGSVVGLGALCTQLSEWEPFTL